MPLSASEATALRRYTNPYNLLLLLLLLLLLFSGCGFGRRGHQHRCRRRLFMSEEANMRLPAYKIQTGGQWEPNRGCFMITFIASIYC